jgi:hypothetical protein
MDEDVYAQWYFIMLTFVDTNRFGSSLIEWIKHTYMVPQQLLDEDQQVTLTADNINKNTRLGIYLIDFKKQQGSSNLQIIEGLFRNYVKTGRILRGTKKMFGLFLCSDK